MSGIRAIAFFGASGGCGLSALKHSLANGDVCTALCRSASKMTGLFPPNEYPNLAIKEGNARDLEAVKACLVNPTDPTRLVDSVCFTIGGLFNPTKMTVDDPKICRDGVQTILDGLAALRQQGVTGRPRLSIISTTGISEHGRDVPLLFIPMYSLMLKVPHVDKKAMEDKVLASGEDWVLIRPSFLGDGETENKIRVGIEDLKKGIEKKEVGYTISRQDVGKWMYENTLKECPPQYRQKAVSITN